MLQSLECLPDEILHSILILSFPTDAAALQQTSRRFGQVTSEPLLWRHYCRHHYRFWDSKHNIVQKLASQVSFVDWKALYTARHRVHQSVCRLLDGILACQTGRIEKFRAVIDLGYDAKDTLLWHSQVTTGEDHLARRYYAQALLTCLHRSIAIPEWAKLRRGEPVSYERAMGAFDLFILQSGFGDLNEVQDTLDRVLSQFIASHGTSEARTPRETALLLASWLRDMNFTGIESGLEYHALEHNFLGLAIKSPGHNSLPLISAVIYCYFAQKIGLNARPCGFPFHVHVIISPPLGLDMDGKSTPGKVPGSPMYIDPFRGARETPISDLRDQLNFLGTPDTEQDVFLGPLEVSETVIRCSKNILNSIHSLTRPGGQSASVDVLGAKYAALWSIMLLAGETRAMELRHQLPCLMELFATEFPSDIFLVEKYIAPLFQGLFEHEHILESLHVMRAVDEIPKQVRKRSGEKKHIRFKVGQVFQHRRYFYRAIITGWDSECDAGEQWMRRMGIDRLQAGRHQSFYHVLAEDRSMRYVAEENIELIFPKLDDLPQDLIMVAGKHFKRWDAASGTFVSNMRDEYPDD
ncbi:hypothetical protein N7468_008982 [Penicillium chermesinum]|uniref:F-box domain-containing protein n=1 Tax=Penicillium chermesinum TaxID=63820 RepID=A0A9W9NHE1_9EURO|nr:uncharacterized protein N7468_008982 [Penicillium chermesinum]KAJ5219778.1 hypothetical protein N7468_008982 [Penicillium chermesinum]KAJ6153773.1 hypothetical protein N7470_006732 [Penicillium chermesinum]